jgi:tripartite-type tricarboxylate transporter receptor subunit TctC
LRVKRTKKERKMRSSFILASAILAICALSVGVEDLQAQPYPAYPINLVVTMDPGSAADTAGRVLAEEMDKVLKKPVMVINKPGAGSILGADYVVKSKKDGYTLLYATSSAVVHTKATSPEVVPFDPFKDLEPLGLHCFFPLAIAVQETAPWKTFQELIDHARKNPGAIRVSVASLGNIDHFNVEIIQAMTGVRFTVVPFKGAGAAITALLGGHVEAAEVAVPLANPHVQAGKVRILILSNKLRDFPGVPTSSELGYKENLLFSWFSVYGPAGLPDEVKNVLVPAIEKAVKNPELASKLEKLGFIVEYRSPADLRKLQTSDYAQARALAVKIGLTK